MFKVSSRIPKQGRKPIHLWKLFVPPAGEFTREAVTKSEARAILKRNLGLQRLPPGSKAEPLT